MATAPAAPRPPRSAAAGRALWLAMPGVGLLVLFAGALAVTWTIPFQEWDAYSAGFWAVRIAEGSSLLPPEVGRILKQRPLVYVGEGLIWRALGRVSMRAARLYSLAFAVALVLATYRVARSRASDGRTTALLAAFLAAASPLVTEQVSSTLTDIPAAAMLWWGFVAARSAVSRAMGEARPWRWLGAGFLLAAALLAKPTVAPLVPFLLAAALAPGLRPGGAFDRKARRAAWIGLAVPAILYVLYFDYVRHGASWSYVLVGWAGPYYSQLAEGYRLANLRQVQWFGVFLSACLVVGIAAAAARSVRATGRAGRALGWVVLAGAGAYVLWGCWGLTDPLRPYDSGSIDRWVAGPPALFAVLALGVAAAVGAGTPTRALPWDLLAATAPFLVLWWWKLGYDRRFLVAAVPAVAVFAAEWVSSRALPIGVGASAAARRLLAACGIVWLVALAWEGGRRMDRGFPAFSRALVDLNRKDGPSPEAKLADIFGESARDVERLQAMARQDPFLKFVSPDNRMAFHLGRHATIRYVCTDRQLSGFDVLVWVHNPGVLEQYARKYGIADPLGRLLGTGRLTLLWKSPEYEVFRIRRDEGVPSGRAGLAAGGVLSDN